MSRSGIRKDLVDDSLCDEAMRCPHCGSDDASDVTFAAESNWDFRARNFRNRQRVCHTCDLQWFDVYATVGTFLGIQVNGVRMCFEPHNAPDW